MASQIALRGRVGPWRPGGRLADRDRTRSHGRYRKVAGIALIVVTLTAATVIADRAIQSGHDTFGGVLESGSNLYLDFPVDGTLAALYVRPGQVVRSGQVLASLHDTTALTAVVTSDRAAVRADRSALAELQAVVAGTAPAAGAQTAVAEARQAVIAAKAKLQAADTSAAQQVTDATGATADSTSQLATAVGDAEGACAAGSPTMADCTLDRVGVSAAEGALTRNQAALRAVEATTQRAIAAAVNGVTSSRAALVGAQRRLATPTAAEVDADQAQMARDQGQLVKDTLDLSAADLVAPSAGRVTSVSGAPGDLVGPSGVRQAVIGDASAETSPDLSLLPSSVPPGTGSLSSASTSTDEPLVVVSTGPALVVAEVPEHAMAGVGPGAIARVRLPATVTTLTARFLDIDPDPREISGRTVFDVVFALGEPLPAGVLGGMSADVAIVRPAAQRLP